MLWLASSVEVVIDRVVRVGEHGVEKLRLLVVRSFFLEAYRIPVGRRLFCCFLFGWFSWFGYVCSGDLCVFCGATPLFTSYCYCFFGGVLSSKMILGKFGWLVFFEFSPLASATDAAEVDVVGDFGLGLAFLPLFGGHLCHLESDKLSSLSDVPCQFEDVSFLPRGSFVLSSVGMKPPWNLLFFFWSALCVWLLQSRWSKFYRKFCSLSFLIERELTDREQILR